MRAGENSSTNTSSSSPSGACAATPCTRESKQDRVVQFRLQSLALRREPVQLAHDVYKPFAPDVSYEGLLGGTAPGKEPLGVYVMGRMKGITWLDFWLQFGFPDDTAEICASRMTLIKDIARQADILAP